LPYASQPPFDSRQPNGTGFEIWYLGVSFDGSVRRLVVPASKDDPNSHGAQESIMRCLKDQKSNLSVELLAAMNVWRATASIEASKGDWPPHRSNDSCMRRNSLKRSLVSRFIDIWIQEIQALKKGKHSAV
jgi:hypothetical protein